MFNAPTSATVPPKKNPQVSAKPRVDNGNLYLLGSPLVGG